MKNWNDLDVLLKDYPISKSHQIVGASELKYHETLNISMKAEYSKETDDFEITDVMYKGIVNAIEENKDKQMYVRVYPEITASDDGVSKHAYVRLQFIDKPTWGESPIKDMINKQINGDL